MLASLDTFQDATKKEIQSFSYMKKIEKGEIKEEEELDAETLLDGIPEDLLDEESLQAKRKAQEKREAEQESYNKRQTLADVLKKSSENILDYVLERNLADADEYIKKEDQMLQAQSRVLLSIAEDDSSELSGEEASQMKKINLVKKSVPPKEEKIEFWQELRKPK